MSVNICSESSAVVSGGFGRSKRFGEAPPPQKKNGSAKNCSVSVLKILQCVTQRQVTVNWRC